MLEQKYEQSHHHQWQHQGNATTCYFTSGKWHLGSHTAAVTPTHRWERLEPKELYTTKLCSHVAFHLNKDTHMRRK